ncbi:MAG: DNA gyrase inhibitor YacG, partial [Nitrospirota bacterium]
YRPFCSERCKLIDLGRWAGEKYRIPGEPVNDKPEEITKETDNGNN